MRCSKVATVLAVYCNLSAQAGYLLIRGLAGKDATVKSDWLHVKYCYCARM